MFRYLLILLLCLPNLVLAERQTRIMGGEAAPVGEYPWVVAIHEIGDPEPYCMGALIHAEWIITAAHCLENSNSSRVLRPTEILLLIGGYDYKNNDGIKVMAKHIIQHPDYWQNRNSKFEFPDIGLIQLTAPVNVEPLSIASQSELFTPGNMATVLGWGATGLSPNIYPDVLQQVQLPIVAHGICQHAYLSEQVILPYSLCAGYAVGGKDSCIGDSGAPLVIRDAQGKWQQLGIVSFGGKKGGALCAGPNAYGVHTKPAAFVDFIYSHVPKLYFYQGLWQADEQLFMLSTTDDYMALVSLNLSGQWLALVGENKLGNIDLTGQLDYTHVQAKLTPISDHQAELEILPCESCPLTEGNYTLHKVH